MNLAHERAISLDIVTQPKSRSFVTCDFDDSPDQMIRKFLSAYPNLVGDITHLVTALQKRRPLHIKFTRGARRESVGRILNPLEHFRISDARIHHNEKGTEVRELGNGFIGFYDWAGSYISVFYEKEIFFKETNLVVDFGDSDIKSYVVGGALAKSILLVNYRGGTTFSYNKHPVPRKILSPYKKNVVLEDKLGRKIKPGDVIITSYYSMLEIVVFIRAERDSKILVRDLGGTEKLMTRPLPSKVLLYTQDLLQELFNG